MEHLALLIYSICAQAAIGIMIFTAIYAFVNKEANVKKPIIVAAILGIFAAVASLAHLGNPLGAYTAILNLGSSNLSREILATVMFVGITVVTAVVVFVKKDAKSLIKGLSCLSALVGLATVYFMANIYLSSSIVAWDSMGTIVEFYSVAFGLGAVLFMLIQGKDAMSMKNIVAIILGLALASQVAFNASSLVSLGSVGTGTSLASLAILFDNMTLIFIKWLFIVIGAVILIMTEAKENKNVLVNLGLAAALVVVGQIIGRYLFYAMMVTGQVGMY